MTLQDGRRSPPIHMRVASEEAAAKYSQLYADAAARDEVVLDEGPGAPSVTVAEWFGRWFDDRPSK